MSAFTLLHKIDCQNRLGEGVQWNPRDQSVWWTDIQSSLIYRYSPSEDRLHRWPTPERVSCFAFSRSDSRLLVAAGDGFAWLELDSGRLEWLARPEQPWPGNRMNDGRVDRQGRFWAGGIVENPCQSGQTSSLYCFDGQQVRTGLQGLTISNALCWNRAGTRMYHADSPQHRIMQYPFNPQTGEIAGPGQLFAATETGVEPDGACIDSDDCLWNAQWGGGRVRRYSPDGRVLLSLEVPVSQPTCVAFGGPDLSWLLVTSATQGMDAQQREAEPLAGSLLIYKTNFRGLPEECFI